MDKAQQYQHIGIMEQTIGNDNVSETDANVENLMNKKNNVTKSNKCIFLCKRFEDPFENTQWRKVKQMQPV